MSGGLRNSHRCEACDESFRTAVQLQSSHGTARPTRTQPITSAHAEPLPVTQASFSPVADVGEALLPVPDPADDNAFGVADVLTSIGGAQECNTLAEDCLQRDDAAGAESIPSDAEGVRAADYGNLARRVRQHYNAQGNASSPLYDIGSEAIDKHDAFVSKLRPSDRALLNRCRQRGMSKSQAGDELMFLRSYRSICVSEASARDGN